MPPSPRLTNEAALEGNGKLHGLLLTPGRALPMKEEFLAFTVLHIVSRVTMKEEFLTRGTSSHCFTVCHEIRVPGMETFSF